jgi:hypothetical protein
MCDLSDLLQTIMAFNARCVVERNAELNLNARTKFYQELLEWSRDLPTILRSDVNFTPGTSFLR